MELQHNQPAYSVSEISARIKRVVEDNFGYVRVRGEISKISVNQGSGHAYLTLKDDKSVLDSVCWKGTMNKLVHRPQAGMEVIATGKLTTYPGRSNYQLVIEAMEPAGVGALMAMLEQRKTMLAAEGLFDAAHKRPIPYIPDSIGIITSPTGAVIRDILHRLADRFPRPVLLWPVAVQGAGAAEQIAAAIAGFNRLPEGSLAPFASLTQAASGSPYGLDTIYTSDGIALTRPDLLIVARGGGSIEDLWAFNEEIVVRAVAASTIPVISAVGHETDTTLIDYVADKRAPTPTGAAEFAVPVREELRAATAMLATRQDNAARRMLQQKHERMSGLARGLPRPQQWVATMAQTLDGLAERLHGSLLRGLALRAEKLAALARPLSPRFIALQAVRQQQQLAATTIQLDAAIARTYERRSEQLAGLTAMLASLNIAAVLRRGFALVQDSGGRVVTQANALSDGQAVQLQFHDGARAVTVGSGTAKPRKARAQKPQQAGLFDDELR